RLFIATQKKDVVEENGKVFEEGAVTLSSHLCHPSMLLHRYLHISSIARVSPLPERFLRGERGRGEGVDDLHIFYKKISH
ncbi:hypothetical protein, partial [Streptococcus pneumoniae]|uniref:hypothetical protein n=1 Tax=Streptococcus pneumoniae TaxID=1313 RepID=UPI001E4D3DEA